MRHLHPFRAALLLAVTAFLAAPVLADGSKNAKVVESAPSRWASKGAGGEPDFTRHVVPLMGKLGCNNRACHGSFQGQNGFRLSLFGHDAAMDFAELTQDEGDGPRVDLKKPAKSLALLKPSGQEEHEGGVRMQPGSWQYRLLESWITGGAKFDAKNPLRLERVELTPAEVRLSKSAKEKASLKLTAWFSDGTQEDVTPLTIFTTNDETVAEVSAEGEVSALGPGDTAIVANYGGAVITSQVIVPVEGVSTEFDYPANSPVDDLVATKLRKVGIRPSELSSDEVFIRRLFLDCIGTLPTAEEVQQFLADRSPDKRERLIDQVLARGEYAMYWATKFSDWTGNDNRFTPQPREKTGWLWHNWLRDKLSRNVPYDELVSGFITATTREGRSAKEAVEEYQTIAKKIAKGFDETTYASRQTNDMYWLKAGNSNPETLGLQAAYAFLGVRLECAQCHKHPFDQWTQADFKGFTQFFSVVARGMPKDVKQKDLPKVDKNQYRYTEVYLQSDDDLEKQFKKQAPKLLAGNVVKYREGEDPRERLMQWMRSPDNRYFSRAIANRLWGHYLGVGIVDPVDDLNAANPPSNPQLLDWLAKDFVDHKFDLKHLHRRILTSRTYQLSWEPNDSNRLDERNFSHALLRRMPAEVVMDAINQVTGGQDEYSANNAPPGTRAINLALSRLRGGGPEYVLGIFGRPLRTQTCDCERGGETGLAQAMYLLNDVEVNGKIGAANGRLAKQLAKISDDRKLIEELYLGTLSRRPQADELERSLAFVKGAPSRETGLQDVLWSLLNLREFVFIH